MPKPTKISWTTQLLEKVKTLAAYGLSDDQIAIVIGVSERTLARNARPQLMEGRIMASAKVTETAYKMATDGKNPAMTMFWLKCRLRWREVPRDDDGEEKLEKVKAAVKDIVAALNRDKLPAPEAKQ